MRSLPMCSIKFLRLWLLAPLALAAGFAHAVTYSNSPTTFSWIDSAAHTNVSWTSGASCSAAYAGAPVDDDISAQINLGFSFSFGSTSYTTVQIMSNGRLQFGNGYCGFGTQTTGPPRTYPYPLPDANLVRTMKVYAADLDPSAGGTVRYATLGTAPNRRFVVTWTNVPEWNTPAWTCAQSCFNLQVILYENGEFVYQFGSSANASGGKAQIGWELTTTDFALYTFSNIGALANTAVRFFIPLLAEYRMEEASWSGGIDVIDSSGSNNHGQRVGAAQTIAGGYICRGGNIPANTSLSPPDAIDTRLDVDSSIGSGGSIMFWYRSASPWNSGGSADGQLFDAVTTNNRWFFLTKRQGTGRLRFVITDATNATTVFVETANNSVAANTWKHIAVTWALASGANQTVLRIYIDGALSQSATVTTNGALTTLGSLYLGDNRGAASGSNGTPNSANGVLDEARIYGAAVGAGVVAAHFNATRPCVDHFSITNSGTGITCQPETVTLTAHNTLHAAVTNYTGTVNLTTGSGIGDWSLITGAGTFSNGASNDGAASYTYAAADNGVVVLALKHTAAGTVNINASDGSVSDTTGTATAADDANVNFVAAGFRFIDAANVENIGTQIAGKDSDTGAGAQTLYLQAIRTDTNTGACVGVFPSGGNATIGLASRCVDPVSCSAGKNIAFTNNGVTTGIAPNNNAAPLAYTNVNLLFTTNSRAQFKFNSPDVGRMSLHAMYNIPLGNGSPSGNLMLGSSNAFVVKPYSFVVSNIVRSADSFANPAAANAAGAAFIKAGDPFSATVTAVQLNGTSTPNYGQESIPESVSLSNALAGGLGLSNNPGLANPAGFSAFSSGVASGSAFSWGEVGIIVLTPNVADGDYLGVGNVIGTTSANVGRFTAHHFSLSGASLTNRSGSSCVPASSFTYMSEALQLGFILTAQNASNTTTQNYSSANGFAKLDGAVPGNFGFGAINIPGVPLNGARLDTPLSSGSWASGNGTFTASVGILRAAAPDGPYNAVNFGTAPSDSDGVVLNSFNLDADNNGSNERGLIGSTVIRYGRMHMQNAYGSELLALQVPAVVQYFSGGGFLTNGSDSCTTLPTPTSAAGLTFFGQTTKNQLAAGETTATLSSPIVSGNARLRLSPPGAGNFGFLDAVLTVPTYLQFDWNGDGSYTDNPRSRARFGLFKNPSEFIYLREAY